MMQTIARHEEDLVNSVEYYHREKEYYSRQVAEMDRGLLAEKFHAEQIAEAKRRGIAEFDRDRFMVKRKG